MSHEYEQLEARILAFMSERNPAEAEFNACALALHRFQKEHNAPYGNYCKHLGAPVELESWRDIPAVPQIVFKQYEMRVFPAGETVKTFRTSGTTGEGFGSHHFRSLRLYEEAIVRGWARLNLPEMPFLFLSQTTDAAPHSSLGHMFHVLAGKACDSKFFINGSGALELHALEKQLAGTQQPIALLGTALAFLNFFEQSGSRHYALPPGSFAMETGGYKGSGRSLTKPELYSLFATHLGLQPDAVINEYGMTELSSQFYTRGLGNAHEAPPWMKALIIDPETEREVAIGETGVIRIFDLANIGSVLAIQTQDLAIRRENGFELLGRDPAALPRGCSRADDEMLSARP